jgi:hypothetical protein
VVNVCLEQLQHWNETGNRDGMSVSMFGIAAGAKRPQSNGRMALGRWWYVEFSTGALKQIRQKQSFWPASSSFFYLK